MRRHPRPVGLACLLVLSVIAFANSFPNQFAFDDELLIEKNHLVHGLRNLPRLFVTDYWAGSTERSQREGPGPRLYRPLAMATYALNYSLGGLHTAGYHLVNLILHVAVSGTLLLLARRFGCSAGGALVAAAVFAVHPLHTEAVTGITGRAELMMALGTLLAIAWYLEGGAPDRLGARFGLASVGAFTGALLSKEQAMVLPALLVVADLAAPRPARTLIHGAWRRYAPYAAVLVAFLLLRAVLFQGAFGASAPPPFIDNPLGHVGAATRLLTALKVAGAYLRLFVWPDRLSADYSFDAIPYSTSVLEPAVLAGLVGWTAIVALGVHGRMRGIGPLVFGTGLTLVTFLPASNLLVPSGTIMAERLFYLPSAGLCLLAGVAWDAVRRAADSRPRLAWLGRGAIGVLAILLLALTARTVVRNADWRDSRTLMEAAVRVVPDSAKVVGNLARTSADLTQAIALFERAIRIYPSYPLIEPDFSVAYGSALLAAGRTGEAITYLGAATVAEARLTFFNLGLAHVRMHRWIDAEVMFRNAILHDPGDAASYNGLSFVLAAEERNGDALAAANEAIRLAPGFAEAHYNRGRALEGLGRVGDAVAAYGQALEHKPDLRVARDRRDALARGDRR